jgi:hypothetical protein
MLMNSPAILDEKYVNLENIASQANMTGSNNYLLILAIIILIAMLGINVFYYLGEGTDFVADVTRPIVSFFSKLFGYSAVDTAREVVKTASSGTKRGIDLVEDIADDTLDIGEAGLDKGLSGKRKEILNTTSNINENVSSNESSKTVNSYNEEKDISPVFTSKSNKSGNMAGFCYIGEDRGNRSCIEVESADLCMSGDIFPTHGTCINPNLRHQESSM